MKKLSIEEKAKRYDEAVRGAYIAYKDEDRHLKATLERIFPELKESEDKMMIKFIKQQLFNIKKTITENYELDAKLTKAIDWIEKQGGITKLSDEEQNKFAKGVLTSCALSFIDYLDAHKYEDKMCVSNGECEDIENAFHNAMWDRLHRYYCKYIEKQGEQKTIDKIEPKFHEGEWLCENKSNNYARFIQILEIVNVQGKDRYRISRDIHSDEDIVEFDFVEKYYHKFDIQDAKAGDVLADDYGIYIFEKFDECDKNCYVCIGAYQYSQKVYECEHMLCSTDAHPATKEQRDLLFQKMKESGYEWDAEKKELKMIEQKHSAWSEEDKRNLDWLITVCERIHYKSDPQVSPKGALVLKDWLKSLKDRYTWKPSDEDMKALADALSLAKSCSEDYSFDLRTLYEQLKKLKKYEKLY